MMIVTSLNFTRRTFGNPWRYEYLYSTFVAETSMFSGGTRTESVVGCMSLLHFYIIVGDERVTYCKIT